MLSFDDALRALEQCLQEHRIVCEKLQAKDESPRCGECQGQLEAFGRDDEGLLGYYCPDCIDFWYFRTDGVGLIPVFSPSKRQEILRRVGTA